MEFTDSSKMKREYDEGPFIFMILYYLIGSVFYAVMGGVYFFSISQIVSPVLKTLYVIITISLAMWGIYVYFKYPENQ